MSAYSEYFLNSSPAVGQLETIEISHPSFSSTKWVVRNHMNGLTAKLENGNTQFFDYYPLRIESGGVRDNLDQSITVTLGDLGDMIPQEIDRIATANTFNVKPICKYRTYRSDDLNQPLFGPVLLEVVTLGQTREGAAFVAQAPSLNVNKTGENYTMDRFPMLRGFL